jgi:hypothetical protein
MAYRGKLSHAQKFVLAGTILGMIVAVLVARDNRLVMFALCAIGAIAGGVAYAFWNKRQGSRGG